MTDMKAVPEFARGHQLGKLARRGDTLASEADYEADTEFVDAPEDAEVVLSISESTETFELFGAEHERKLHRPIIDLDMPAALVPSSMPGHFHLYIDKPMEWHQYQQLLLAFHKAGLIERGYLDASEARGFTSVRLPWVKKKPAVEEDLF